MSSSSSSTQPPITIVDYGKDPKCIYEKACEFLRLQLRDADKKADPTPLAAVFDVDDTLLCDHPEDEDVYAWHPLGWKLYNFCLNNRIQVHIITARFATTAGQR